MAIGSSVGSTIKYGGRFIFFIEIDIVLFDVDNGLT